jgi:hypothetical protein
LFWLTQRQLLRFTRAMKAWFHEPPPDDELLLAEVSVTVWLPGPDLRGPSVSAEAPPRSMHPAYGHDTAREASDYIPYRRDPGAGDRRRYVPADPREE